MTVENFIPFGAQYYRAPTPLPDCWEIDLQNIKNIGFNTIKIWAQWRWNNPKEDEYYFDDLDRLMDLAYQKGLRVIINVIFDVAPAWFYKKYPESVMVTADGRRVEPQTTGWRQIGGAPGPCYHHEKGIYYRKLFLNELVKRYYDHPAMYIWDLWNEPELTCGILREPRQEDMVCYCQNSISAFGIWLRKKYNTIGELNKRWNRNYYDWDDIEVPRNSHVFNDMIDWRTFFAQTLTDELGIRVSVVREWDCVHPVMVHTVPYFNLINACNNDYGLAGLCDMFGNSVGSHPFAAAHSTSCAPGKTVINSEIHALAGNTYNLPDIPLFEEMKKHILIPLARGIKGFLFWQYRPETLGLESPAWGLTTINGEKTDWLQYCIEINNTIQKYANIVSKAQPLPAKIAIVNGSKNQIFDWCVTQSIDRHYHSVFGVFMAMYRNNYNVNIISTDQINELGIDQYQVIYYPFPYYMEYNVAAKLKEWVKQGGTLVSEALFGAVKESDGLYSTCVPGYGLDEVFGVRQGSATTASSSINAYESEWIREDSDKNLVQIEITKDLRYNSCGDEVYGYFFMEELIPHNAEVLAQFKNGKAAITCGQYGRGQGIMIGTLMGYQYGKKFSPEIGQLICSLIDLSGINPYVEVDKHNIRVDLLTTENEEYIVIINSELEEEVEVDIKFNTESFTNKRMVNMMTNQVTPIEIDINKAVCRMKLQPLACEMFLICKETANILQGV